MSTTPNLGAEYLLDGQSGKGRYNRTAAVLDAAVALRILDRDLTAPPGSPSAGDTYIVAAGATGDWASQDGKLAIYYNAGWLFRSPVGGLVGLVVDEKRWYAYSSVESEWHPVQDLWSTTEHWTGRYGRGGGKLYAKCLEGITCPNATSVNTAHGITGLDVTKIEAIRAVINDGTTVLPLNLDVGGTRLYCAVNATNFVLAAAGDYSAYTCDVRLEYEKV